MREAERKSKKLKRGRGKLTEGRPEGEKMEDELGENP